MKQKPLNVTELLNLQISNAVEKQSIQVDFVTVIGTKQKMIVANS